MHPERTGSDSSDRADSPDSTDRRLLPSGRLPRLLSSDSALARVTNIQPFAKMINRTSLWYPLVIKRGWEIPNIPKLNGGFFAMGKSSTNWELPLPSCSVLQVGQLYKHPGPSAKGLEIATVAFVSFSSSSQEQGQTASQASFEAVSEVATATHSKFLSLFDTP